jgi:protocatechuate 3,4-dioxygenase beta subunit
MKPLSILALCAAAVVGCTQTNSQKNAARPNTNYHIGGLCEGCEAIYESPVRFEHLPSTDTLPDFYEAGPKLEISGVVYEADRKTPAKNVVVYVYHTDQTGRYSTKGDETGWGKRHGYIRGWMKTDEKGYYRFYTLKPAPYPGRNAPAHIHIIIKEPDKNEYWIDEYLFNDDPLLTAEEKERQEKRGGNGIITLTPQNGFLHGERDIFLGRNIPGYPSPPGKN